MIYHLSTANWATSLGQAIRNAEPNSTIVVATQAAKTLGERAAQRMKRFDIKFVVETPAEEAL